MSSISSSMSSISANTTGATKLRKKSVTKQTLWKTAVSMIANNVGVLVLVLILAHIVKHIAKVEKILEVHVDRKLKLGSEVSGLQSDLGKRMDDKSLEGVLNGNEMGLDEIPGFAKEVLNGNEWLTREEFDKFVEEFKGWKGGEMGLDEIRAFAKGVVEKEIEKLAKGVVEKENEKHAAKALWMTVHSQAYVSGSGERLKGESVRGDLVKLLQPSFGQPDILCCTFVNETSFFTALYLPVFLKYNNLRYIEHGIELI
nr:hypothetical protein [Tanacetum cinerariifolium]